MSNTTSHSKMRVGILFGGQSAEHDVSVQSAKNVVAALDTDRFEPVLIRISKQGVWQFEESGEPVSFTFGGGQKPADVMFPILHGPMGEDGTVQGLLEMAGIPYVGPGVLGSAAGMDKDVMKRLLRDAGIAVSDFVVIRASERQDIQPADLIGRFGLPLFVKPASMGSSIGISKVASEAELAAALDEAFTYDRKVLVEAAVAGDEIECAVLGNDHPQASIIGRVIPHASFYSYDAKYIDDDGADLEIPAALDPAVADRARALAVRTFQTLECEGMGRVDMFVTQDGELVVNEINTIPGFTNISMYPKLWEASGLSYSELITRLIELALERFEARRAVY